MYNSKVPVWNFFWVVIPGWWWECGVWVAGCGDTDIFRAKTTHHHTPKTTPLPSGGEILFWWRGEWGCCYASACFLTLSVQRHTTPTLEQRPHPSKFWAKTCLRGCGVVFALKGPVQESPKTLHQFEEKHLPGGGSKIEILYHINE